MSDLVDNPMEREDYLDEEEVVEEGKDDVTFDDLEGGDKGAGEWEDSGGSDDDFFALESKVEKEEKEDKTEETDKEDADQIKEDIISRLDGKTKVKIKGKEYDLNDLSSDEIVKRFQLAGRAYEIMQKSAEDSKDQQRLIDQAVENKMRHLFQEMKGSGKTSDEEQSLPEYLKPNDMDTDELKALKQSQALLLKEITGLKTNVDSRADEFVERQFVSDVDRLKGDYPAASLDEVIAIKSLRPDVPTEDIMRASHDHYAHIDFIKTAIEANPEAKRELSEMFVKEYKAKVQKARGATVPRRRSGGSVSRKVTEKTSRPISTFADIEARSGEIDAYLRRKAQAAND